MISEAELKAAVEKSWNEETARGEWNPENPPLNQCAVTALVVQYYMGGYILRCKTTLGGSHYWNKMYSGLGIDFTLDQFKHIVDQPDWDTVTVADRDRLLNNPDTSRRYNILLRRVFEALKNE